MDLFNDEFSVSTTYYSKACTILATAGVPLNVRCTERVACPAHLSILPKALPIRLRTIAGRSRAHAGASVHIFAF